MTIRITRIEAAVLLESATDLIGVKLDAIEHERCASARSGMGAELARHRRELQQLTRLAAALRGLAKTSGGGTVAAHHPLLDELVTGALVAEAERLVGDVSELARVGDVGVVHLRLETLGHLIDRLATLRS